MQEENAKNELHCLEGLNKKFVSHRKDAKDAEKN